MNLPLNIDLQQIFLHMLNFVILVGGLYFILYSPVKKFMDQRTAHYAEMDKAAADKLAAAEKLEAEHKAQLDKLDDELRQRRAESQKIAQDAAQQQLDRAQEQADQIVASAQKAAESIRSKALADSQKEIKELAMAAAEKLTLKSSKDAFDEFLNLAEEGNEHHEKS